MTDKTKTWFITGASRGLGLAIAQAALDAGDNIVATARYPDVMAQVLPASDRVLHVALDVTDPAQAEAAVAAATARFDTIDVLVNNAGYGQLGVFEEIAHQNIALQFDTNVFGLMHVTRAALPVMRAQKSGRIFNLSSIGGTLGFDVASVYCAAKFAVEGFSECLALELAPFNIGVTIVEPGFFRTDFLDASSIKFADTSVADYADYAQSSQTAYLTRNHQQPGDPAKLGAALVQLSRENEVPLRFAAGSDALQYIGGAYTARQAELASWGDLTRSTDITQ
ncbi:MAG: SDR family NAD(P)-dependent oxidoreductase [Pseudomonadota bacterium]